MGKIKKIFFGIKALIFNHRILSVIFLIIIISSPFVVNYFISQKTIVQNITQAVKNGNINISVSGTGQIYPMEEVKLTSEVSGKITGVYVVNGEEIKKGDLLFKIDSSVGEKNLKAAQISLETAQLDLEETQESVDELTLLQSENSLIEAKESKIKAEGNLEKAYDDGFNNVSNAFLDLSSIMTGLSKILFLDNMSSYQENLDYYYSSIIRYDEEAIQYKKDVYDKYIAAKAAYEKSATNYKTTSRFSSKETIEALIFETYDTTKLIAESIRSINNLIEIYKYILSDKLGTYNPIADTHFSTLNGYTSKTNSHLLTLLSAKNSIDVNKDAIISSDRAIEVRELSLEKIKEGATDLEVRIKQLAVEQKQADLDDAQETLANYSIRSPFSGNISVVNVSEEDMVNVNAIMGSIITHEKIATIILNEVDIANVKVGQEANITFDALDDFTVKGEVYEVDTIGTANQGVVSYGVKIYFNTDNESVKPGMSISASLIIQSVSDVLVIPISAVKVMDEKSFVSVMNDDGTIERKIIEIGITDDYLIEVKNGLEIGDKIVTSTVVKNVAEKDTNEKKINAMQFVPGNTENIKQVIPGGGRGR